MFKTKLNKTIWALMCIVVLLMPYVSTTVIATQNISNPAGETLGTGTGTTTPETKNLIANFGRIENTIGYRIGGENNKSILKITEVGKDEFDYDFYCLEPDDNFPEGESEVYVKLGELGDSEGSLKWYSDNIILQKASNDEVKAFINTVFAEYFNEATKIVDGEEVSVTADDVLTKITKEDINVAQQLALWYLSDKINKYFNNVDIKNTSFTENSIVNGYNILEEDPDNPIFNYNIPAMWRALLEVDPDTYALLVTSQDALDETSQNYFDIICNYLIAKSVENADYTGGLTTINDIKYPTLNKNLTAEATVAGDNNEYFVVGPFEVKSNGATDPSKYHITFSVNGYTLFTDRNCENPISETNVQNVLDQQYYIRISSSVNDNVVRLSITHEELEGPARRTASVWEPEDSNYQKVLLIEETPETITPDPDEIPVNIQRGDLALRKFVYKVNGEEQGMAPTLVNVGTETNVNGANYIAEYKHAKNPVEVKPGDKVIYQINVYNEGDIDAKALEITDYLPNGLVLTENSTVNSEYGWTSADGKTVKTTKLADTNLVKRNGEDISSAYVRIECTIADTASAEDVLTNIAEITKANIKDKDSTPGTIDGSSIPDTYSGNTQNDKTLGNKDGFYRGIQDDDDFAKVIVKIENKGVFDLALKKFIKAKNGKNVASREPKEDTTPLKNGEKNAKYNNTVKTPITVQSGDIITYTIRVYNEGTLDGYAEEVADYIPEGLGFLVNYKGNIDNFWSVKEATANGAKTIKLSEITNGTKNLALKDFTGETKLEDATVLVGNNSKIVSTKLSSSKASNILQKFDGKSDKLDYKDIEVTCIVLGDNLEASKLKNIAEVKKNLDENKEEVTDRDSTPNTVVPNNYPGSDKNQDDNDYENLVEDDKKFDLSLQKFISKLNDEAITDREPSVTIDDKGKIQYNHKSDPLKTANTDLVEYTIRVYNEGEKDGYAAEIQDDIPVGLIFVTDNETNKKYGWKMYDKYGKETTDVNQATTVKTNYLSKEAGEERKENTLLEAFKDNSLSYNEVKIVFKVDETKIEKTTTTEKRIVKNTAEISENQDEYGNPVEDTDSIPGDGKDGQDDIDYERIYIKYFDLALEKYLSKIIIIEDGKTQEIVAKDKESLLKVEVHRKKVKTTVVKFVYDIVVTNQGEIAGYAKEVKDYIPDGLKFVAEDNKEWKATSEKEAVTDALAKTLLEPGKSATVNITLTWVNGENNLGIKTNFAEISEDYNDKGDTPDIDSTPNNNVSGEDDIDDAPVMLAISTGNAPTYLGLTLAVTVIFATGVAIIKKYVL